MKQEIQSEPFSIRDAVRFVKLEIHLESHEKRIQITLHHRDPEKAAICPRPGWLKTPTTESLPERLKANGALIIGRQMVEGKLPYMNGLSDAPRYATPGQWLVLGKRTQPMGMQGERESIHAMTDEAYRTLLETGNLVTTLTVICDTNDW